MKTCYTVALAIFAGIGIGGRFVLPLQAQVAYDRTTPGPAPNVVGGPEQLLYIFSGVADNGMDFTGYGTTIHCFNGSGATETIRYVIWNHDGAVRANLTLNINNAQTKTAITHYANNTGTDLVLNTGIVMQGTLAIYATSTAIVCTAQVVDAASLASPAYGVPLHPVRFNPIPGTQEAAPTASRSPQ